MNNHMRKATPYTVTFQNAQWAVTATIDGRLWCRIDTGPEKDREWNARTLEVLQERVTRTDNVLKGEIPLGMSAIEIALYVLKLYTYDSLGGISQAASSRYHTAAIVALEMEIKIQKKGVK